MALQLHLPAVQALSVRRPRGWRGGRRGGRDGIRRIRRFVSGRRPRRGNRCGGCGLARARRALCRWARQSKQGSASATARQHPHRRPAVIAAGLPLPLPLRRSQRDSDGDGRARPSNGNPSESPGGGSRFAERDLRMQHGQRHDRPTRPRGGAVDGDGRSRVARVSPTTTFSPSSVTLHACNSARQSCSFTMRSGCTPSTPRHSAFMSSTATRPPASCVSPIQPAARRSRSMRRRLSVRRPDRGATPA